jgi:spermidine synthase
MAWQHIASAPLHESSIDLYAASDGAHMIRVNGLELMNSRYHRSEDLLGTLAGMLVRGAAPNILLGGLGLGYTLASLARSLGGAGTITVAEISDAVITWFDAYFRAELGVDLSDAKIVHGDVATLIASGEIYDAIVVDVDNGPEALATEGNAFLYSSDGLEQIWRSLGDDGLYVVWSGFESAAFCGRAESAGFTVACMPVALPGRSDLCHYLYVLSKQASIAERLAAALAACGI